MLCVLIKTNTGVPLKHLCVDWLTSFRRELLRRNRKMVPQQFTLGPEPFNILAMV